MTDPSSKRGRDPDRRRIEALVRTLRKAEQELQAFSAEEITEVMDPSGNSGLVGEALKRLQSNEGMHLRSAETQTAILNALPAHIALLDSRGNVVAVNESWRRFAAANLLEDPDFCIGSNYLEVCDQARGDSAHEAHAASRGISSVLNGQLKEFTIEYSCHSPGELRWFRLSVTPLGDSPDAGAVVMHVDITEPRQTEEQLRKLSRAVEQSPASIVITDLKGNIEYVNPRFTESTGYTPEEVLGKNPRILKGGETTAETYRELWRTVTAGNEWHGELHNRRKSGELFWELTSISPVLDPAGNITHFLAIKEDITDRKAAEQELARINRALQLLSTCNEALIRAEHEQELLDSICHIAVEHGGYRMAWVGFAMDDEGRTIAPRAHAGEEHGYLSEVTLSWSEETEAGRGPAGRTIRDGQISICSDMTRDPTFPQWRDAAEKRDYRSAICLPLRDGDRTFGLLGLYSSESHHAGAQELKLLQELANDLAFGIMNLRSSADRQRLQNAVMKVAAAVSASTGTEFFEELSRNMAEALDAQAGFVARLLPGEPRVARTIAAVVEGGVSSNFDLPIQGTPCENLFDSDTSIISRRQPEGQFARVPVLAALRGQGFAGRRLDNSAGQPLGLLGVVYRHPVKEIEIVRSTLQIFAARAASELERQQTEDRLREQAALLAAAHEAIFVTDLEDRIIYWNKGAERTYGWSTDEALGRNSMDLFRPDLTRLLEAQALLLETGEWRGELQNRNKHDQELTVEVGWTLMRDMDGGPKSILAINTDITEKKKLETQLLRAQRMDSIGTLAGGIAHDLNNVLAPILLAAQLLRDEVRSADALTTLNTLQSCAERGADLVKQVLTFARGIEGERLKVNVAHLLWDIGQFIQETFPKNIKAVFQPARDLWTVTGDPTQLHQMFMNLCINARDAMPRGGRLKVTSQNITLDELYSGMNPDSQPGPYVLIQVEDTGTGIPQELRERIFEPFFTTKETGKGTGLGLSTTLAILRSHGGFVNVYSEPGQGATFKVYLPANATSEASETVAVVQTGLPRGHGETILLVDDEQAIRDVTRKTLERFGYRVMLAMHGAEAVALYAKHRDGIAVVITDMAMPVMDGPSTIIALKSINPKVKIIGSSGLAANGLLTKAVGAGVSHFIPKPYSAEVMLRTLAELIADPADSGAPPLQEDKT